MALVHTTAAKLQPAISLNVALSDFEAVLTEEQKRRFTASPVPDANAAVRLAIEIDHDNASRRGRCLGTRLVRFFESVQQFSDVVGTFASSNPQIAALVWGGVKLSLLVVNNFASFFDKLSTVLMQIGRTCPRLAEFGAVYITSTRLQRVLCEYYAVVVKLCKSAIEFSRKSGKVPSLPSFQMAGINKRSIRTSRSFNMEAIRNRIQALAERIITVSGRYPRGSFTCINASTGPRVISSELGAQTRQRVSAICQRLSR